MSTYGPQPTRLRQIALITTNLEKALHLLTRVIGTEVIFCDPLVAQWGLKNFLLSIGGDVIEVCAPFQPNTTAGRLLEKKGSDGGYMIIMQTLDAKKRKDFVESKGGEFGKVIWGHDDEEVTAVQYHPKGVKGGMMPELDSHAPTADFPDPLSARFSPWHAAGKNHAYYSTAMKRRGHLQLTGAVLRLESHDTDTEGAAKQWETRYGAPRNGDVLEYTNAKLKFVPGVSGKFEGLESITIAVEGERELRGIVKRAREEGVMDDGYVEMLGVRWYFELAPSLWTKSKL